MTQPIDAAKARKFVENVFCAGYHHDPDKMIQESEWLPFVAELLSLVAVPSVPDAVREAAENIFSFYERAGVPDATTFDCIVARYILSACGADDGDEPVTEEWLRSIGFVRDEWHDKKMTIQRKDALPIGLWHVDDGWKAMLIHHEHAASCLVRQQNTRGKVRQLLSALGIAAESAKGV